MKFFFIMTEIQSKHNAEMYSFPLIYPLGTVQPKTLGQQKPFEYGLSPETVKFDSAL